MATLLSDTFTRADSTTSPGTPDTGGPYTAVTGTWGISSNKLYVPTAGATNVLTVPAAANLTAQVTVTGTSSFGTFGGLVFRYVDASNYWYWVTNAGYYGPTLYRRVAGSNTQLTNQFGSTWTDNFTLKVEAYGNAIYCSVNGALKVVLDDGTFSTATTAGFLTNNSSTAPRLDDATFADLSAHPSSLNGSSNIHVYKGRDLNTDDTGSAA